MANDGQSGFNLTRTKVSVEGTEGEVIFHNLTIHQALADVNSFAFIWRQPGGEASLAAYVSFYQKNLSKGVKINIQDHFSFKGFITSINVVNGDELGVHYEIKGKGLFAKLDEAPECNSFMKKSIRQIFTTLNTAQGLSLNLSPNNSAELFYTVQYNQTAFDFYRMLAVRHGEWLFYNGTELVLGSPGKQATTLRTGKDLDNVTISAEIRKASVHSTGFDQRKGAALQHKKGAPAASAAKLIAASTRAGEEAFGSNGTGMNLPHVTTQEMLSSVNELHQKGIAAATVIISAHSYNNKLNLGGRIRMQDGQGKDSGEYIITEIHHFCDTGNNYENHFSAVPAEVEVPPYTNPTVYPHCKAQPAVVTDNADKDGLDRIKVRFPWQKESESTPWINVLTPHAGKDKGFRFLPEVKEEVLVGFIDDNAEKPFFMGAIHTEQNKSADAEAGNHIKVIGTRTGRRMEINDDKGTMRFYDNFSSETPKNGLLFVRKDDKTDILLESQKSSSDYSVIQLANEESLNLGVVTGGTLVTEIRLEKQGQKITIHSKGSIELNADDSITLNAANININASQELKMSGEQKGASLKGKKVALESDTTMDIKGIGTTVEGSAKLDLKAGALASIVAALVKIN